jgi:dolichyl-phosphate beta-glucosyltransferase
MPTSSDASPHLSLIIPAFNEVRRLETSLRTALAFLEDQPYATELILADDGSTDGTAELAAQIIGDRPQARVLSIPHGGKARAVRAGMLSARGELIGFSDIDLATPLEYLDHLRAAVLHGCEIAIASREGIGAHRVDEPVYRHVMGRLFNLLVRVVVLPGIDDTQCGFKLFRRDAAQNILQRAKLYTNPAETITGPRVTAFDVELLVIAKRLGYRVCPIPVVWTAGEQSKVNPISDTIQNFSDVLKVRLHDWKGHYS